jgi:hypothetical protein
MISLKLTNKAYDVLKDFAQIYIPALGVLYATLAPVWNLPDAMQVGGTVLAVDTFLGVVLKLSSTSYNNSDAKYDGTVALQGSYLKLKDIDPVALTSASEITLKLVKEPLPREDQVVPTDRLPKSVADGTDPRLLS